MNPFFYIITDCANLSHQNSNVVGRRFLTQKLLDIVLLKSNCHGELGKLPRYTLGMEMKTDQLYKTGYSLNQDCCSCYVIKTNKVIQSLNDEDIVDVDNIQISKMFN